MNLSSITKRRGIAILVCLAVAVAAAAQRPPADLIVTNAKVVTMNRQRPRAAALAVRDGDFVAVGEAAGVAPYRGAKTRVLDARGHAVIHGLVDSHSHAVREGRLYNHELRWDGVDSLDRGPAMIREQANRPRAAYSSSSKAGARYFTPSRVRPFFTRPENFEGRWIIDHAEGVSDRNIERVKRLGGGVAVQDRMAYAGEYYAGRYGKEAAASAPPPRKLLDSGVPLGVVADMTRVGSYNPWLPLYWMVSGRTVGGTELYARQTRLTREEALRLYALGSACFSGEEEVKGHIAPGQYADFAALSADYLPVPEERIKNIESVLTVVAGKIVYAARPFRNFAPARLPAVIPAWPPVAHFGGCRKPRPPGPGGR